MHVIHVQCEIFLDGLDKVCPIRFCYASDTFVYVLPQLFERCERFFALGTAVLGIFRAHVAVLSNLASQNNPVTMLAARLTIAVVFVSPKILLAKAVLTFWAFALWSLRRLLR